MTLHEQARWEAIAQLNASLADSDLRSDACIPVWEAVRQVTGAGGMVLEIEEDSGDRIARRWGETGRSLAWDCVVPLERTGRGSRIILYGEGASQPEERQALARAACGLIDTHIAGRIAFAEERSQRLLAESLVEISRVLNSSLDLEQVLEQILERLAGLVPYDSASVMLLSGGQLYMHAATGYRDSTGPMDVSKISFVPSQTAMMDEVMAGDEPLIIPDTREIPNWLWTPSGEHVRCWLAVPLQVKGQVIGLFSIDKFIPNFFTARHAQLAKALGAHAALALNNARLFAEISAAQEQLQGLSAKVIEAQEAERQKIAVELHDQAGQALLGLRAELQILRHHVPSDPETALEQINYLDAVVLEISQDLRHLAHDLHPPILTELGLEPALEQYVEEFGRRMSMPVTFEYLHDRQMIRLPANIELICYRIVQEALTNLAKHARATRVKVSLDLEPELLKLTVIDDGIGFKPNAKRDVDRFGLIGMRERVTAVGGQLQIFSQPGRGTQVAVTIPLEGAHDRR
jgi:signal transduction histidine kinase